MNDNRMEEAVRRIVAIRRAEKILVWSIPTMIFLTVVVVWLWRIVF